MSAGYFDKAVRLSFGQVAAGAAIEVRHTGGGLADIYSNDAMTVPLSNPGVLGDDGRYELYALFGVYNITVGAGASAATYRFKLDGDGVNFLTRADFVSAVADGYAPSGGTVVTIGGLSWMVIPSEHADYGTDPISDLPGWMPVGDVTPNHFGAVGDGETNDTVALTNFFTAGGGSIRNGVYMCDDLTISNLVDVRLEVFATIRKRSGATANSKQIYFAAGSEGSSWVGGVCDGNSASLAASYLLQNPSAPPYWAGWMGMVSHAANVTVRNVTFVDHVQYPFWFAGDYNDIQNIVTRRAGAAGIFGYEYFSSSRAEPRPSGYGAVGQNVANVRLIATNNNGRYHSQHALDFQGCKDGVYRDIIVIEQDGDTSGAGTWLSAMTFGRCETCLFEGLGAVDPQSDTLSHLMVSILGDIGSTFVRPFARRFAGMGHEVNACIGTTFIEPDFDGEYVATTVVPEGTNSVGLSYYEGNWNVERTSKSRIGSTNCRFIGGRYIRNAIGGQAKGGSVQFDGTDFSGNLVRGINPIGAFSTDFFAGASDVAPKPVVLNNVTARFCGKHGLYSEGVGYLKVMGGDYSNNGQDGSSAYGIGVSATERSTILEADAYDDQDGTMTDGASFQPGDSVNGFVYVHSPFGSVLSFGQKITLKNAGSSGDVTGTVYDIGPDDVLKIRVNPAVTLVDTVAAALSGTWTGSTRNLSGSGGAMETEVTGQVWVTDGSEWRRIVRVTDDDTIVLDSAFTAPLSGETLEAIMVDIELIPSQQVGLRAFGTATNMLVRMGRCGGNTSQQMQISTPANLLPGSRYTRESTTTTTLSNQDLQTNIPVNHKLTGVAARIDSTIGGATSWSLLLIEAAGSSTIVTVGTGLAVAKNTNVQGILGYSGSHDSYKIRAAFNSAPSGGSITCVGTYSVDGPETLPVLP